MKEIRWIQTGETLPLNCFAGHPANPKAHPPEQIAHIKNSILQFGFLDPVGIWGEKAVIVEGHGRIQALRELEKDGLIRIPESGVPVLWLDHLTKTQRDAYMLEHNHSTMESGWDETLLEGLLQNLSEELDMEKLFGFSLKEPVQDEEEELTFSYQLVIDCAGEEEMQMQYEKLQDLGFSCRAVVTS